MFKIGQKIVCVSQHRENILTIGKIYTIRGIHECKCGMVSLDVGINLDDKHIGVRCRTCDSTYVTDIWYIGSDKFRPIEYNIISNFDIIKEEIIEKLDVPIEIEVLV